MLKIEHKLFSSDDIENFINLSIDDELRSEGMKKSEIVEWKFIKNPLGPSNYFFFKENEKVCGRILSAHYPGKLAINQKIKNSYCLSDLYIHKSYRQLSNLKNLYLSCLKNTNGVIFHSSNENSEKFYTKILKKKIFFKLFSCGLPLTVKPLKDLTLFKKLFLSIIIKLYLVHLKIIELIGFFFSSTSIKEYNQIVFDGEIKETFDKNLERKECFFYKDKNFFNWRYKNYENFFLLKIFSNKYFLGYITLVGSEAMDLKNLIIMDFQFVRQLTFLQKLKLKLKILEISKKLKFDTIFTFGNQNSFMFKNILGYPFLHLPDKILPHSNPMFIHNTDGLDEEFLIKMNFTISDFDYF